MSKHLDENQLTSYVCRTLTDTQREAMDVHIGTCQGCRARLGEHQALHRRARYSIMDRRREGSKSSQASFAEVAPRLRRSRRMTMFWTGSKQFVLGAATLAVLVVLVVGLIAFFGGIGQPTTGSALQPLTPGTYVTTITQEDSSRYSIVGTWELTLAEDNRWSASHLGRSVAEGHYSLTPDQIVFTHEKGPYTDTCTNIGAETGIYKWTFDGQALTLTTIEDECADRNEVWTTHPWSKVELPPGTYVTTIIQEDFLARDDLDLVARTILLGEWEMTLTEGNGYSHDEVTESGQMVVAEEGYYTLTRDQMVFTAEGGDYACIGPQGIYQWALDGKTLTLTTVEDPCPERNTLNSAHPWTRQD
jgi:hypothetical protein